MGLGIFSVVVAGSDYIVADHGPLHGPVTGFSITRDKTLNLMMETVSASDSKSNAEPREAGTVYIAAAEVKLTDHFGSQLTASGVIPRSHTKLVGQKIKENSTKEISSIHSLHWRRKEPVSVCYTVEWVENMSGSFLWPHFDEFIKEGQERRRFYSPLGEVILSAPVESRTSSRSCVHLFIDGFELFVGVSKAKPEHISNPGFILYKGEIDEATRSKIRDCLSFCLGNFLIYLGETCFNEEWVPVSFVAKSGHALVEDAPKLSGFQPAPLGMKYQHEITSEILGKMVSSLLGIYDAYRLQSVLWSYWHALAAPAHMTAAHFGAAIESLQKTFVKASGSVSHNQIVRDENSWKSVLKKISISIAEADLTVEEKKILTNNANQLNFLPQGLAAARFFSALDLKIEALENRAWVNRNRAAHGGATQDDGIRLIRENKVLHMMMNRILLALAGGSSWYYDYYTIGRPTRALPDPIQDDRNAS